MEQAKELIRSIQKGLLQWYAFVPGRSALYTGDSENALAELLRESGLTVTCAGCVQTCEAAWLREHAESFDYIVSVTDLERESDPGQTLRAWRRLMKPGGRLLLGMNNRFGIRYFCGDQDPYTKRNFDGIEGYRRAYVKKEDTFCGRCYSHMELKEMLRMGGWESFQFFSVLPDLYYPGLMIAEDYLPNEALISRVTPIYHNPSTVFLEEEGLYDTLLVNGMFHQMANAYLIECVVDGEHIDVDQVTSTLERGRAGALLTVIHKSGLVEKHAVYPEGRIQLEKLIQHSQDLAQRGLQVIAGQIQDGAYTMPYIHEEMGQIYLERLFLTDQEAFLREMDHFRNLILQSSEIVKPDAGDGQGAILRYGYPDMVPLNSFHMNGTFAFFDQEFREDNYPANEVVFRMIATFYAWNWEFQKRLPMRILFDRYGLTEELDLWHKMEWDFLTKLRKEKELRFYHEQRRRNADLVHANRQRMNYSEEDYRRLFVDIFRNADTRKLVLFGSGTYTKRFLALYGQDYPVYAIIDNNKEKWGQSLEGIPIHSPALLREMQNGEYKVLICIKNYLSVMKQLDSLGVTEYSIFDPNKDYPRKRRPTVQPQTADGLKKKFHVGYIAGVFDLFHVGHLNMFKRAKEQCDYLIVGVVTDEGVRKFKETETFVPFAERIELVRSCRYVDEAVEIPLNFGGTRDAWRLHHFDCQFSGSDYADNPDWQAEKEFLEKRGAEMVFFPYTESTSSSKLKTLIESKLL